MPKFTLHPQLQKDSLFIKTLTLSEARLMNNRLFPWIILVPKRQDIVELFDLPLADQGILLSEINQIAKILKTTTQCHKINIASLGNIVSQLHIHIIARFETDSAWPKPVFGLKAELYENQEDIVSQWREMLLASSNHQ